MLDPNSLLKTKLDDYEMFLQKLQAVHSQPSESEILSVLAARDVVQEVLAQTPEVPSDLRIKLVQLDQQLRQQAEAIAQGISLPLWRESFNPPDSAWWWYFPDPVDPRDRFDWLWSGLTVVCLTASLGLVTDISTRFLTGGTDLFGSIAIVGQSVLTLLAGGSALTQVGQEATERLLQRSGISRYRKHEAKFGISAGLLLLLVVFHGNLPQIAKLYNSWGENHQSNGNVSSAQDDFRRALQLNPDYATAHYNLGTVYDNLTNTEAAATQYRLAAEAGKPEAYNHLARLYIRQGEYDQANTVLAQGQQAMAATTGSSVTADASNRDLFYNYYTNLGWVLFKQSSYEAAVKALQKAIQIDPNQGAAHCLLAQTWAAQGNPNTDAEWQACAQLADRTIPEQNIWYTMAQKNLRQPTSNP